MLLNKNNIEALLESVDFHHALFLADQLGTDILSRADKNLLKAGGIDLAKFEGRTDAITYSYMFGQLEATVRDKRMLAKLDLKKYKQFVKENPGVFKMTRADREAIHAAKLAAYNDIKRLAGDIKADYSQILNSASKSQRLLVARQKAAGHSTKAITTKVTKYINTEIAKNQPRYEHRINMITGYNMHSAYQEGIAAQISADPRAKVYFNVHPDACDDCVRLYLKNGPGSEPRIFFLTTLINNGNNIGRKPNQYKPSIQPIHPHCRCKMNKLPAGKIKWDGKISQYVRVYT